MIYDIPHCDIFWGELYCSPERGCPRQLRVGMQPYSNSTKINMEDDLNILDNGEDLFFFKWIPFEKRWRSSSIFKNIEVVFHSEQKLRSSSIVKNIEVVFHIYLVGLE